MWTYDHALIENDPFIQSSHSLSPNVKIKCHGMMSKWWSSWSSNDVQMIALQLPRWLVARHEMWFHLWLLLSHLSPAAKIHFLDWYIWDVVFYIHLDILIYIGTHIFYTENNECVYGSRNSSQFFGSLEVRATIADISHNRHNRRWWTFSNRCTL